MQIGARLAQVFNLTGKIAVVTGSGQGLGRATAQLFAEAGAQVVIADLNAAAASSVAAEIESKGGIAFAFPVDVSDELGVNALFDAIDAKFGAVDILVNNVAYRSKADFFTMSVEQWDKMFDVTVRGTFLCSRAAIPRMRRAGKGGSIVNISSVGSVHTTLWGVNSHYDAAKAGVDSLTRSLSGELAADNIRVNSVLPGGMASEGGKAVSSTHPLRGPIMGAGRILMGRVADPLEVANCVLFLASPAASYVTGQTLAADGGFMVG
jgi:NAD(P)-dependent dehydrogenase (short-subunit alcohol dehydrogenase family)